MLTKEQFEAKSVAAQKEGFRRWMQEPLPRALISTIPPCENLELILEAAFNCGFGNGSVHATIDLLSVVMEKRPPR